MGVSFFDRLRLGYTAFKEAHLTSAVVDTEDWTSLSARRLRYNILWAQYEQTSYRNIHLWATAYRKGYALYKYVRPIYNPAWRLGEFWKAHLFGGLLDPKARTKGAIPIETDSEKLRGAIANLWKWSRWQVNKDIVAVRGTILGDIAIKVMDDVSRGQVYLELVHPGLLDTVEKDPFGNIKAYTIREIRSDPRGGKRNVEYKEVVNRDGVFVVFETFLDNELFAWPENVDRTGQPVSKWAEPYGFVPLVVIQHNDVGLEWGWSELHPIRAKVHEADDIAAQLSDHIRKSVDPVWLMRGMKKTEVILSGAADTADDDVPAPGREELRAIWGLNKDCSADAMVADLNLDSVLVHLDSILKEIERDVVELSQDIHTASGDASGRALRTARQPVISKVVQRRANYDAALVAAQQMAIAIGGWRGYEGYKGFNLESYEKGDLDHSIAERPVFEEDPLDQIEIDTAFWKGAEQAQKAGVELRAYLKEAGWDEERITELLGEEEGDQTDAISERAQLPDSESEGLHEGELPSD